MRKTTMILALLALLTSFGAVAHSQERSDQRPPVPTLTVNGQGEVSATPDRATVNLGAEAQGRDAASAQSQVNAIIQRALTQIRAVGIEERKIQTSGLQLFPIYENQRPGDEGQPKVVAYRASNTLQIQVDNLTLIGRVIDAGVAAGANRVENVSFALQNDLPSRNEALRLAVSEARTKAETLAAALGVTLVEITEANEGGVSVIPPRPFDGMAFARSEMKATPVQPGELQVQASVTLRYRIAPRLTVVPQISTERARTYTSTTSTISAQ